MDDNEAWKALVRLQIVGLIYLGTMLAVCWLVGLLP